MNSCPNCNLMTLQPLWSNVAFFSKLRHKTSILYIKVLKSGKTTKIMSILRENYLLEKNRKKKERYHDHATQENQLMNFVLFHFRTNLIVPCWSPHFPASRIMLKKTTEVNDASLSHFLFSFFKNFHFFTLLVNLSSSSHLISSHLI